MKKEIKLDDFVFETPKLVKRGRPSKTIETDSGLPAAGKGKSSKNIKLEMEVSAGKRG